MNILFAIGLGYLLGSIPFGLLLTRLFGAGDIRSIGSGNIGATNVLRTGRKGLAAATLLLDGGKGFLAVWLASYLPDNVSSLAGLFALIGHCFPVWLGFRGGKGVATMLGVSLAIDPRIGFDAALVWVVAAFVTRRSSVGGMCLAVAASVAAFVYSQIDGGGLFTLFDNLVMFLNGVVLGVMALIVVFQHRANIKRLLAGTEPRVGQKG